MAHRVCIKRSAERCNPVTGAVGPSEPLPAEAELRLARSRLSQ